MITVLETEGSAYSKTGTRAFVTTDGDLLGIIGGGCFDADVLMHSRQVLQGGSPLCLRYDSRQDDQRPWGLGSGCLGRVELLLEVVRPETGYHPLPLIVARLRNRRLDPVLLTHIDRSGAESGLPLCVSHTEAAGLASAQRDPLDAAILAARNVHESRLLALSGARQVLVEYIRPQPQLLVLGAGRDVLPLLALARVLEWRCTVVDHRAAHASKARLPDADAVHRLFPEDLFQALLPEDFDAALVMSHSLEFDTRYLGALAATAIPFIGLLGPAARRDRILAVLGAQAAALHGRLQGPVGLHLGGRTPAEIAYSVLAQVLASHHGADGGRLSTQIETAS
jgi:xanthine dehydrogenase accessory factor